MKINIRAAKEFIFSNMHQSRACPICNSKDQWVIFEDAYEIRTFEGGPLNLGENSRVVPLVVLMCNVCGHTLLFNAIATNAIERQEKSSNHEAGNNE